MTITEQTLSRVSFAVKLLDDFSGTPYLVDATTVFIKETGTTTLQNPSGYQVFTDVTETQVTIRIENKYYAPEEVDIDISTLDPRNPVTTVTMKPNYLYPFPPSSTLVRGKILNAANNPIEGAEVTVVGDTVMNRSGVDGRFVLYWGPLEEDDISVVNNHRYLKIGGSTTIQSNVRHPSFQSKTITVGTITERELKLLTTPIVLTP